MRVDRTTIPGYTQAVQRENQRRDAAFLNLPAHICGIDIRQMTLRDFIILDGMDCPFLRGKIPLPHELRFFLWFMSEDYRHGSIIRRWWFYRVTLRKILFNYKEAVERIYEYMDATFQDSGGKGSGIKSYTGYPSAWVDMFEVEYGWPEEKTLSYPLRKLHQRARNMRMRHDPQAILFNPSDKLISRYLQEKNRAAKENLEVN
jgi:hypothetical protein